MARIPWRSMVAVLAAGVVGYGLGAGGGTEDAVPLAVGDTQTDTTVEDTADEEMVASSPADPSAPDARPLVARTAADGTLVRAIEIRWQGHDAPPDDGQWYPPPSCRSVGNLEIALVTDVAGPSAWAEVFADSPSEAAVLGSGTAGYAATGLVTYAAVRAPDHVEAVRLLRDGEVVDEAQPERGWAIVAVQGAADGLEVVLDDGTVDRRPSLAPDLPYERAECQPPPPPLPDGAEAPDAETEAAIVTAVTAVYARPSGGQIDPRGHLERGEELDDEWLDEMRERVRGVVGEGAIDVEVGRVGLVGPDEAVVVFRLIGAAVGWTYHDVVRADDGWLVRSQSWCTVLSLAGVTCPDGMRDESKGASAHQPAPPPAPEGDR